MTTIQALSNDINGILNESKKRYQLLRQSCEMALTELKNYNSAEPLKNVTDPKIQMDIMKTILLCIETGNSKLIPQAFSVLNLIILNEIVSEGSLPELIHCFKKSSLSSSDVSVRVLQCLPSLIRITSYDISGDSLIQIIILCSSLASDSKASTISSIASATLQQILGGIFDVRNSGMKQEVELNLGNDDVVIVSPIWLERYKIFNDLCSMVAGDKIEYLDQSTKIKKQHTLEIIEGIIINHRQIFSDRTEMNHLLRHKLVPALVKILQKKGIQFSIFIRSMRIVNILVSNFLVDLEIETEILISFLNYKVLDSAENLELKWDVVVVLESIRSIFSNFDTLKSIFKEYDLKNGKKNVVEEIYSVLSSSVSTSRLLIFDSVVKPTQDIENFAIDNGKSFISKSDSAFKLKILDSLDRIDPPKLPSPDYYLYLILQILILSVEGAVKFSGFLQDSNENASDIELLSSFVQGTFESIYFLFESFLFCLIDNEDFHLLVRSLQRYIFTIDQLGLDALKNKLLMLLSSTIISQGRDSKSQDLSVKDMSIERGVSRNSKDTVSSSISKTDIPRDDPLITSSVIKVKFNSRRVICLRAFTNLTTSFEGNSYLVWQVYLATLQWTEYFVYGVDEYSTSINPTSNKQPAPDLELSTHDLNNIKLCTSKLLERVNEYDTTSFENIVEAIMLLSKDNLGSSDDALNHSQVFLCPYNPFYYFSLLLKVCEINPVKFLIKSHCMIRISEFFIEIAISRDENHLLKSLLTEKYCTLISKIAESGFNDDDKNTRDMTSEVCLDGIKLFFEKLLALEVPMEMLIMNNETEMHLTILNSLHNLIDAYDAHFQNSWRKVFEILNASLEISSHNMIDNNLREKQALVITSSFNTLKLILDEFLSTLPYDQLKASIDTLSKFSLQEYDLNLSFSSISYFWLVSDSIRSKILAYGASKMKITCPNEDQLLLYLHSEVEESKQFYFMADLYLVLKLSKICKDRRAHVRDGAIQTFFQILEVHGTFLNSWDIIYEIALSNLFDTELVKDVTDAQKKIEWIESFSLSIFGLVSLSEKFTNDFKNKNKQIEGDDSQILIEKLWSYNLEYFKKIMLLGWPELESAGLKAFHDLIILWNNYNCPGLIRGLLFDFWINTSIDYDFFNPVVKDVAVNMMKSFPQLYLLIRPDITSESLNRIMATFNKCARYPALLGETSDDKKPTELQRSVMHNIKCIDTSDNEVKSIVIQQLTNVLVYPFGIRSKIEEKLGPRLQGRVEFPSFIAVSALALQYASDEVSQIEDVNSFLEDGSLLRLLKGLMELVSNALRGSKESQDPLWLEAKRTFIQIVKKIIACRSDYLTENMEDSSDISNLIIEIMKSCVSPSNVTYEDVNLKLYFDMKTQILPHMLHTSKKSILENFIQFVYKNSFIYEPDEIEVLLLEDISSIYEIDDWINNFNMKDVFGLSNNLHMYPNRRTRIICLRELIDYASSKKYSKFPSISEVSLNCFISRSLYALYRCVNTLNLIGRAPIPRPQREEVATVVKGLLAIHCSSFNIVEISKLQKLHAFLSTIAAHSSKLTEINDYLGDALIQLGTHFNNKVVKEPTI